MKRRTLGILTLVVVVAVVGIVAVTIANTAPDLKLRTVNGHIVWEWAQKGVETFPHLFSDNSHMATIKEFNSAKNGGWIGVLFDIDSFDLLNPDPQNAELLETDATLGMSSKFRTDEECVVWEELHDQPDGEKRFDTIKLFDIAASTTETIIEFPYPSPVSVMSPDVSGNIVVFERKTQPNNVHTIYSFDRTTEVTTPISPTETSQAYPQIEGNYVCWLDWRNEETTGIDILGYNLSTNQEFIVNILPGDIHYFHMNSRYVLYKGILTEDYNNLGLYLYDLQTQSTITITENEINEGYISVGTNSDDTYVCWDEQITNDNGTFWAVKYKKVSDNNSTFVTGTTTIENHQVPSSAFQTHIGWVEGFEKNSTGIPFLYKIATGNNFQLDDGEPDCGGITMDDTFVMWYKCSTYETENGTALDENICGCMLDDLN